MVNNNVTGYPEINFTFPNPLSVLTNTNYDANSFIRSCAIACLACSDLTDTNKIDIKVKNAITASRKLYTLLYKGGYFNDKEVFVSEDVSKLENNNSDNSEENVVKTFSLNSPDVIKNPSVVTNNMVNVTTTFDFTNVSGLQKLNWDNDIDITNKYNSDINIQTNAVNSNGIKISFANAYKAGATSVIETKGTLLKNVYSTDTTSKYNMIITNGDRIIIEAPTDYKITQINFNAAATQLILHDYNADYGDKYDGQYDVVKSNGGTINYTTWKGTSSKVILDNYDSDINLTSIEVSIIKESELANKKQEKEFIENIINHPESTVLVYIDITEHNNVTLNTLMNGDYLMPCTIYADKLSNSWKFIFAEDDIYPDINIQMSATESDIAENTGNNGVIFYNDVFGRTSFYAEDPNDKSRLTVYMGDKTNKDDIYIKGDKYKYSVKTGEMLDRRDNTLLDLTRLDLNSSSYASDKCILYIKGNNAATIPDNLLHYQDNKYIENTSALTNDNIDDKVKTFNLTINSQNISLANNTPAKVAKSNELFTELTVKLPENYSIYNKASVDNAVIDIIDKKHIILSSASNNVTIDNNIFAKYRNTEIIAVQGANIEITKNEQGIYYKITISGNPDNFIVDTYINNQYISHTDIRTFGGYIEMYNGTPVYSLDNSLLYANIPIKVPLQWKPELCNQYDIKLKNSYGQLISLKFNVDSDITDNAILYNLYKGRIIRYIVNEEQNSNSIPNRTINSTTKRNNLITDNMEKQELTGYHQTNIIQNGNVKNNTSSDKSNNDTSDK